LKFKTSKDQEKITPSLH